MSENPDGASYGGESPVASSLGCSGHIVGPGLWVSQMVEVLGPLPCTVSSVAPAEAAITSLTLPSLSVEDRSIP